MNSKITGRGHKENSRYGKIGIAFVEPFLGRELLCWLFALNQAGGRACGLLALKLRKEWAAVRPLGGTVVLG